MDNYSVSPSILEEISLDKNDSIKDNYIESSTKSELVYESF
jgi:hypothetical protein